MEELPLGITDFRKVREGGYTYVDKTSMLDRILGRRAFSYLFVRPRGFGKSLTMSMLDAYLNMQYKGNDWFDGLKVSELRPDDQMKNAFPVIHICLDGCRESTFEDFVDRFRSDVTRGFEDFTYLLDSDRLNIIDRQILAELFSPRSSETVLSLSLLTISTYLQKHHGSGVVILVDGYDRPLYGCSDAEEKRKISRFLGTLLNSAFKDNGALRLGVMTGTVHIQSGGSFPGPNNIIVHDITSMEFRKSFGFSEDEVRDMLVGLPGAKQSCGVYRMGDREMYSPREVLENISIREWT